MIIEQIHRHVNLLTFLVENVSGNDADVKMDGKNKVVKWKSLNQLKNKEASFIPVSGLGAYLKKYHFRITNAMDSNLTAMNKICIVYQIIQHQS